MHKKVRILPESVANQIAAGEVVQRPASVVKELIDNSIDAGADKIEIEIKNGGKNFIKIKDNGIGMDYDDAVLSVERHATSKLLSLDDLGKISTYGFRGEALPSIGSISRMTIETIKKGNDPVRLYLEGGSISSISKDGYITNGTSIIVNDIFFNTQARRKFLKSETVEAEHIAEVIYTQALINPDIEFKFIKDGKLIFDLDKVENKDSDPINLKRISDIFPAYNSETLVKIDHKADEFSISGYISSPQILFANRKRQYTYIKKRYIKDRFVLTAINNGYRHLVPNNRYPALFINITTPDQFTDFNVHPTKLEVVFLSNYPVMSLVENGIKNTLSQLRKLPTVSVDIKTRVYEDRTDRQEIKKQVDISQIKGQPEKSNLSFRNLNRIPDDFYMTKNKIAEYEPQYDKRFKFDTGNKDASNKSKDRQLDDNEIGIEGLLDCNISDQFTVVGQIFATFIIIEDQNRLLLLDQHTVHERVLFDRLAKKFDSEEIASQMILIPKEIQIDFTEISLINKAIKELEKFGYIIENFENKMFMLRGIPNIIKVEDAVESALELIDKIYINETAGNYSNNFKDIIGTIACRAAVKSGDLISNNEIEALISGLKATTLPYTCPHGRPLSLSIDADTIRKKFLRTK